MDAGLAVDFSSYNYMHIGAIRPELYSGKFAEIKSPLLGREQCRLVAGVCVLSGERLSLRG